MLKKAFVCAALAAAADGAVLVEGPRELPLVADVDVVVAGGGFAAASAAIAAKEAGASVFVAMPRQNPAEDLISTRRLWRQSGDEGLDDALVAAAFQAQDATTPARCFTAIDDALRSHGIEYFTGAVALDVLKDSSGRVSGIVVADRSGRQAIRAKAVVDATQWGNLARRAAPLRMPPEGSETSFTRVITIAKDSSPVFGAGVECVEVPCAAPEAKVLPGDLHPSGKPFSYPLKTLAVTKRAPLARTDARAVNAIDQKFRSETWERTMADQSETPFFVPPESIAGESSPVETWPGAEDLPLGVFKPQGVPYLYVAGMLADVDRSIAEKLSYPGISANTARRIGAAAAAAALARGDVGAVVCGRAAEGAAADIRETCKRPLNIGNTLCGTVKSPGDELPVLDDVDVLVVGGGTAGGPAAIAAAREGGKTMVAEWLYAMGGTTTEGRIGRYYKAAPRGFTKNEIDPHTKGAQAIGDVFYEAKSEFFRREALKAGAEVLYGALAIGALVEGTDKEGRARVRGAVVVLGDGKRGVVRAKVVVDATGNADIAAAAGADTMFLSADEFAMQGSAASTHVLGESYRNSDVGFLNAPDAGDISHFAKRARRGMPANAWNLSAVTTGSRERRRIVGDFVVTEIDEMLGRTYPDTIMHGESNYDMHGYSTSALMMFYATEHGRIFKADLPYRALLPAALEGVYATGLSVSATRDAMPVIRMQPSVQNQGYAVGIAAAMAADKMSVRAIDVKALQRRLVEDGCLDKRVLSDVDSRGDKSGLAGAVAALDPEFHGMAQILAYPEDALPLLQQAFERETCSSNKVAKAAALLMLGDNRAFDLVAGALGEGAWPAGKNFRGMGNFGRQTTFEDCLLYAIASSTDPRAAEVLAAFAGRLGQGSGKEAAALSRWRMFALAAEMQHSPQIAADMARAAGTSPGRVQGFAKKGVPDAVSYSGENANDGERNNVLRELAHLRARCRFGDKKAEDLLKAYLDDYRTIYAAWAALVLENKERTGR